MSTPRFPEPIGALPADTGTLDAVVASARRRRARRLQASGAALGVALLLAGVVVADDGGGRQTIGVAEDGGGRAPLTRGTDDPDESCGPDSAVSSTGETSCEAEPTSSPEASAVPPYDPEASPGSAAPTPVPSPTPADPSPRPRSTEEEEPSSGSPRPAATKSTPPRESPAPRPSPTYRPASPTPGPTPSEPSQAARGEMRRSQEPGTINCPENDEWCSDASAMGGRPVEFSVRACRDNDAGPGRLESGPPGADFAVSRDGQQLWRWSSGQAFPAMLQYIDVEPGDCYVWSTTWRGVDDYNRPLPSGMYDLFAYVTSPEQLPEPVRIGFRLS